VGFKQSAAALLHWITKQPRELEKKIRFLSLSLEDIEAKDSNVVGCEKEILETI